MRTITFSPATNGLSGTKLAPVAVGVRPQRARCARRCARRSRVIAPSWPAGAPRKRDLRLRPDRLRARRRERRDPRGADLGRALARPRSNERRGRRQRRRDRTQNRLSHTHACHAHVHRARRGTGLPPPPAARAGARPWPASRPPARSGATARRDRRMPASTVPANRGAPGETSPYARTKPSRRLRMRVAARGPRGDATRISSRAMRHGTYSIVAHDPDTGELGAAVQSHWFSVGSLCTWARPGVGAVATQSVVEPAHGPNALDRIAGGREPRRRRSRRCSAPTRCARCARSASSTRAAAWRSHRPGLHRLRRRRAGEGYSCQANMMERDTVPAAMAAAFEAADGDLAARLLAALHGAAGRGRRRPRPPVGRAARRARRGRGVARPRRPARRGPRRPARPSWTACSSSSAPTSWPARPTS